MSDAILTMLQKPVRERERDVAFKNLTNPLILSAYFLNKGGTQN